MNYRHPQPQRVPRFIPDHELDQLMPIIEAISCPFQRAALLAVRWSGARRDEIRRLPLDCLDRYPDGTPRLRLPAGKTYKERMVPILWVPIIVSPYATWEYSWRRPPSRFRRLTLISASTGSGSACSGLAWLGVRCGRWVLK
jgi:hypothetical protein